MIVAGRKNLGDIKENKNPKVYAIGILTKRSFHQEKGERI